MKAISMQIDDETARQITALAERWGLPPVRNNTAVVSRCIERVFLQEFAPAAPAEESPGTPRPDPAPYSTL